MVMNIVYSTVVACLVEVFLIANVSMISSYLRETRYRDSFFLRLTETETLMAFVYLLSGIAIFSVTFFAFQERSMRYISRISSAIQNISEGDLNTAIEVRGDDEFTAMAVNLNKMVGDIRNLMDKEREGCRSHSHAKSCDKKDIQHHIHTGGNNQIDQRMAAVPHRLQDSHENIGSSYYTKRH